MHLTNMKNNERHATLETIILQKKGRIHMHDGQDQKSNITERDDKSHNENMLMYTFLYTT